MSEDLLHDGLAQTTLHPLGLRVAQAKGSRLILEDGSEIIDFISGIGASSFGHSQPEILRAIHEQVDKHLHVMVYGEMRQSAQDLAAQRLLELLPEQLNAVYFVNSGAEAIDAAMKLVAIRAGVVAVTWRDVGGGLVARRTERLLAVRVVDLGIGRVGVVATHALHVGLVGPEGARGRCGSAEEQRVEAVVHRRTGSSRAPSDEVVVRQVQTEKGVGSC